MDQRFEGEVMQDLAAETPEAFSEEAYDSAEILTERELEIATLIALGQPNKQIMDKLHISEWTVSTHLRRIFAKLGMHSRAAMVYRCASLIGAGLPLAMLLHW